MKILIVGGGGREHALAWKCAASRDVERVLVAPGNAGTAREPNVANVPVAADDLPGLLRLVEQEAVDLTIVGPEAPLVAGIVDAFEADGQAILGPRRSAAQLEGSKSFAKDFLARHRIPSARYRSFTDSAAAARYIADEGAPIVVKADGLAAGKGVVLAATVAEAQAAAREMLDAGRFGEASRRIVVEEFLRGEEASFMCLVDGEQVIALASSQDHKARDDGDRGPNTGGMGAYSPAPVVTQALHDRILREVIEPTVRGMAGQGDAFRGFLYAGLMIDRDGTPRVLEYNVRLGDPETQPILLRLRSNFAQLCLAAVRGELAAADVEWDPRPALGVVMAAGGYPLEYARGHPISGLDDAVVNGQDDLKVFHAGTREAHGGVVTDGGRVLCVTALGESVGAAQQRAYAGVRAIDWQDCYYRTDIGYRAAARET